MDVVTRVMVRDHDDVCAFKISILIYCHALIS